MGLHLIAGLANSGKTGRAYEHVRRALRAGEEVVLVVPATPDVQRARRELASEFPLGLRVATFERLVDDLWSLGGDGRIVITQSQRLLLLESCAREQGASRALAAFAERCVTLLSEQVGSSWRVSERGAVSGPGKPLAKLLRAYADATAGRGLIEPAEAAHSLPADVLPNHLVAHRFADFTPAQQALLRRAARAGEVVVTLCWAPGFPPTLANGQLVDALKPDSLEIIGEDPHNTESDLTVLGNALFATPFRIHSTENVRFALAEGFEAEARTIADEILDAIASGAATSFDRIAVAFRDPSTHSHSLQRALHEAGIEADFDLGVPFGALGFGAAMLDLLRFARDGRRTPLLNFLRSGFSGISTEDARELERRWRRGSADDASRMIRDLFAEDRDLGRMVQAAREVTSPLDSSAVAVLSDAARTVLGNRYDGAVSTVKESDARAHARVQDILSDVMALSDVGIDLSALITALSRTTITPGTVERPGHVQVMSLQRLRGRRFDVVIIGGLNAGEMPASADESMLSGSAVHDVLCAFGATGVPSRGQEFEQALFYEAYSMARKRVVLGARTTDSDGDAAPLSPFFEVAADFFRDGDDPPAHSYRALGSVPLRGAASPREGVRAAALEGDVSHPRVAAAIRRTRKRPGALLDAVALPAGEEVLSASQIETYLRCPYLWFYQRAVKPAELEGGFDVRSEGTLAHEMLEAVYRRLAEQGGLPVTPSTLKAALSCLDDVFTSLKAQIGSASSLAEEMSRERAKRWIERILGEDAAACSEFVPAHFEWSFGFEDEAVELRDFRLRGRIDRIDTAPDGRAVVIDYKRSVKRGQCASNMLEEGGVQAALYVEVVRQRLGVTPVAALYRGLARPETRGLVLDSVDLGRKVVRTDRRSQAEFEALLDDALDLANAAVNGMRSGDIAPRPRVKNACDWCPAALWCEGRA